MLAEERHRRDRPEEGSRREQRGLLAAPTWRSAYRVEHDAGPRGSSERERGRMVAACGEWPPAPWRW